MASGTTEREHYAPRFPNLTALLATTLFVLVLGLPFFAGQFLVGPHSDQYIAGYGFRQFWTEYVRAHGSVPLWNPYIFGGLPYVGAMHGDLLYPFSWVRLVVPTDVAMTLAFLVHLVLAGFFTYLFLRALRLPWGAAVTGGIAYQLTGIVASLVHPGHDGKLYVSAMLPLALWALVRGVRDGRVQGFGVLALAVGLAILSPSFQMAYYMLLATGMFTLYLALFDLERPGRRTAWLRVAAALGAVLLGAGIAAVQILPFLDYLPYSPRSVPGSSTGWEYATSYSMPPEELLDTLLPQFSGLGPERYWGRNPLKYHGEYLGVASLILASVGLTRTSRTRLRWALVAIAGFFLLVSLGGHTPFYRLVYELLPMMKKVRAPGMAFYLVAFPVAVWAALGVEAVVNGAGKPGKFVGWLVTLGALLLLSLSGVLTNIGRSLAPAGKLPLLLANQEALTLGALRVALFGVAVLGLLFAWSRGRVTARAFAFAVTGLIGLDLLTVDRKFFVFSPPARKLYAEDAITQRLAQTPKPFRVLQPPPPYSVYSGAVLMGYDVQDVLGYHGNEIRFYDDLLGGKNVWQHLPVRQLWKLLAVRYVIYPDSSPIPGFHRVVGPVTTTEGQVGYLLEADTIPPYARVATAAVKGEADRIVPTLLDPRLDFNRLVLLDPSQPGNLLPVTEMPEPSPSLATVTAWEPGKMTIQIAPAPTGQSYLVVAENWYPDWVVTVDGAPGRVVRGNQSLITVQLPAGARQVKLSFTSPAYQRGKLVSLAALLTVAGLIAVPAAAGWKRRV
ncbi:MAG: YfhO family protein [Gemmatimonadetes bacterium]|nr:YfhO family protein [Gemmatimonadota bacterium]